MNDEVREFERLLRDIERKYDQKNPPPEKKTPKQGQVQKPNPDFSGISWRQSERLIAPIEWDWPGWLPRGFLTVLASEPGMGKSMLCLRLAACYLGGKMLPDGRPYYGMQGRVIWCEGEGSQALNIARAKEWGLSTDDIVTPLPDPLTAFRMDDEQHMMYLLHLCRRREVQLVVMDSLTSLMVGGPTMSGIPNKAVETIPRALKQLGEMARLSGKPFLVTHHLRKRTTADQQGIIHLDRLRGTSKIAQTARVVWTLDAPDTADPEHRRLLVAKNNLAPTADPLGMRIVDGKLAFGEAPVYRPEPKRPTQVEEAVDFLMEFLSEKPVAAAEVLAAGAAAGFSKRTLQRAKRESGVGSRPIGRGQVWEWYLGEGE